MKEGNLREERVDGGGQPLSVRAAMRRQLHQEEVHGAKLALGLNEHP